MTTKITPTKEVYAELQQAYDHFNTVLFDSKLPECLITLQREKKTFGYFSAQRFANAAGNKIDEIALNPGYFAVVPIIETMQTLVHEMCHLWQFHFGKPGRARYHNQEWADKMESIGLMPSSTGQPGGAKTGDCMADYAMSKGRFVSACETLITQSFQLSWFDRFPDASQLAYASNSFSMTMPENCGGGVSNILVSNQDVSSNIVARPTKPIGLTTPESTNKSNRIKYSCNCNNSVWGRPKLSIICLECNAQFTENN